jgi:hypothetical protein
MFVGSTQELSADSCDEREAPPNSLIKQTDKLRGDIPRSTYIRRTVRVLS